MHVDNELRDRRHLYMGLWRFHGNENSHYFLEGALEVCPYLYVPRAKRESKYALIDFVEAAKAMKNWISIESRSRLLR